MHFFERRRQGRSLVRCGAFPAPEVRLPRGQDGHLEKNNFFKNEKEPAEETSAGSLGAS